MFASASETKKTKKNERAKTNFSLFSLPGKRNTEGSRIKLFRARRRSTGGVECRGAPVPEAATERAGEEGGRARRYSSGGLCEKTTQRSSAEKTQFGRKDARHYFFNQKRVEDELLFRPPISLLTPNRAMTRSRSAAELLLAACVLLCATAWAQVRVKKKSFEFSTPIVGIELF